MDLKIPEGEGYPVVSRRTYCWPQKGDMMSSPGSPVALEALTLSRDICVRLLLQNGRLNIWVHASGYPAIGISVGGTRAIDERDVTCQLRAPCMVI